jgi:hypothetical protein
MRSAKIQKATLDPLKISGRCGRLMCCLRYEDKTYDELRKNLPKNNSRVGTREGPGKVVDSKILVQLVLVRLDESEREIAVPVEELMDPETCPRPGEFEAQQRKKMLDESDPLRGMSEAEVRGRVEGRDRDGEAEGEKRGKRRRRRRQGDATPAEGERTASAAPPEQKPSESQEAGEQPRRRRRGRRGKRRTEPGDRQSEFRERNEQTERDRSSDGGATPESAGESQGRKRRRRGRRRGPRRDGEAGGGGGAGEAPRGES